MKKHENQEAMGKNLTQLEDENEKVLIDAYTELLSFFKNNSNALTNISRIIEFQATRTTSPNPIDDLLAGISIYAGSDIAMNIIVVIEAVIREPAQLDKLEKTVSECNDLRVLIATYYTYFERAVLLTDENINGWCSINREVYYDHVTERWQIRLDVETFGGTKICFEEEPTSLLALSGALVEALNFLPEHVNLDVFDPDHLQSFKNTINQFYSKIGEYKIIDNESENTTT